MVGDHCLTEKRWGFYEQARGLGLLFDRRDPVRLSEAAFVAAYRAIERARNEASRCRCEHPQAEHTDGAGRCSAIVVGEAHSAARCSCRRFRLREDTRELGPLNEALAWLESINLAQ